MQFTLSVLSSLRKFMIFSKNTTLPVLRVLGTTPRSSGLPQHRGAQIVTTNRPVEFDAMRALLVCAFRRNRPHGSACSIASFTALRRNGSYFR